MDISSIYKILDIRFQTLTLVCGMTFDLVKVTILVFLVPGGFRFRLIKRFSHQICDGVIDPQQPIEDNPQGFY